MMFIFRYGTDSSSTLIESVSCSNNYLVLLQCNWESQYSSTCADDDKDVVVICRKLLCRFMCSYCNIHHSINKLLKSLYLTIKHNVYALYFCGIVYNYNYIYVYIIIHLRGLYQIYIHRQKGRRPESEVIINLIYSTSRHVIINIFSERLNLC